MVTGGERERNWDGMTLLRLGWAGWSPPPPLFPWPSSLAKMTSCFFGEQGWLHLPPFSIAVEGFF